MDFILFNPKNNGTNYLTDVDNDLELIGDGEFAKVYFDKKTNPVIKIEERIPKP